jgi:hypothetical protein
MELRCPFVSYDRAITHFAKLRGRRFGFVVVA